MIVPEWNGAWNETINVLYILKFGCVHELVQEYNPQFDTRLSFPQSGPNTAIHFLIFYQNVYLQEVLDQISLFQATESTIV